jgi:hypothetical protein
MPVSVNQAGDHESARGVDHLGVGCPRRELGTDVSDDAATDEHVAVDDVTQALVDSDDVAALNKDLFGHGGSSLR